MGKIVAAINMTIDGNFDHNEGIPDENLHDHYTELISSGHAILYGRITYQLMEYWKTILENPTGNTAMDEFAIAIDKIPKIVFSNSLKYIVWSTVKIASLSLEQEVKSLMSESDKNILIGSRSLIIQLLQLNLIDELQLCIHPVIVGGGPKLFDQLIDKRFFELSKTKTFGSGAIILYYKLIAQ